MRPTRLPAGPGSGATPVGRAPVVLTQAFTWNNSASAAGSAVAASLAGRAADGWGPSGALAQAPVAGLILVVLALVLASLLGRAGLGRAGLGRAGLGQALARRGRRVSRGS